MRLSLSVFLLIALSLTVYGYSNDEDEEETSEQENEAKIAENEQPLTETASTPPVTSTTETPCYCEHQSYGKDVMSGEIHSPNWPDSVCSRVEKCVYEFDPRDDSYLVISVQKLVLRQLYSFSVQHFFIVNSTEIFTEIMHLDYSYVRRFTVNPIMPAGINMGMRIIFEKNKSEKLRRNEETKYYFSFKRMTKKVMRCPDKSIITLTEEIPLFFQINHESGENRAMCNLALIAPFGAKIKLSMKTSGSVDSYFDWFENSTKVDSKRLYWYGYSWSTPIPQTFSIESQTNIMFLQTLTNLGNVNVTAYVSSTDCICNATTSIHLNDTLNETTILSPGYPYSFCPGLSCNNEILLEKTNNSETGDVAAFQIQFNNIETFQSDYIWIVVGGKRQKVTPSDMNGKHTFVTDTLAIPYEGPTEIGRHGYNITVRRIVMHQHCICNKGFKKTFDRRQGFISMVFPAECPYMHCRFEIEDYATRQSSSVENIYAWFDYRLSVPGDYLTMIHDDKPNRVFDYNEGRLEKKYTTSRNLIIDYERNSERSDGIPLMDSSLNITWKAGGACSCVISTTNAAVEANILTSPKYPSPYCDSLYCIWTLTAPEGYRVIVNVTDLELEPFNDHLIFFDAFNNSGKHMERLSGSPIVVPLIRSSERYLTVQFVTDKDIQDKGFELLFWAEKNPNLDDDDVESGIGLVMQFVLALVLLVAIAAVVGVVYMVKRKTVNNTLRITRPRLPSVYFVDDTISVSSNGQNPLINLNG